MKKGIWIEPSIIYFPNTFVSLECKFTFKVHNDSKESIEFRFENDFSRISSNSGINNQIKKQDIPNLRNIADEECIFFISPSSGTIWPDRFLQVVATFTPKKSKIYEKKFSCICGENCVPIPLTLKGVGIPASAKFNVNSINIGYVFLEQVLEYEIILQNTGSIPAELSLQEKSTNGIKFMFAPSVLSIPPGSSHPIRITFIANQVCQFNETFTYSIMGSDRGFPQINLYGHVEGPQVDIEPKTINFGQISCGAVNKKWFLLHNKSSIPFEYQVRVPKDGHYAQKEFFFDPAVDTIDPYCSKKISIELVPFEPHSINTSFCIDISKVGSKIIEIPVKADIIVPSICIDNTIIDLGVVFIGQCVRSSLNFTNTESLAASFEFVLPNDASKLHADIRLCDQSGVIEANQRMKFDFEVITKQLGDFLFKPFFRILGSDKMIPITIKGTVIGPIIHYSNGRIDFGSINVLDRASKIIKLTNTSPIPAVFTREISSPNNVFSTISDSGIIEPNQTIDYTVQACLPDPSSFKGELTFNFEYVTTHVIPISASGKGSPIVPSISLESIDFGYILAEKPFEYSFSLQNMGIYTSSLSFSIQKTIIEGADPEDFSFSFSPSQTNIDVNNCICVFFSILSKKPCNAQIRFHCHGNIGGKRVVIGQPLITAKFVQPKLHFSKSFLCFEHVHDYINEEIDYKKSNHCYPSPKLLPEQYQEIVVTNDSLVDLEIAIEVSPPFRVDCLSFALKKGMSKELLICFDAKNKKDFISEIIKKRMRLRVIKCSRSFYIDLQAEFKFPNLEFSPNGIVDFGSVHINTEKILPILMKNMGDLHVKWAWQIMNEDSFSKSLFDIYPLQGELLPNSQATVHAAFSGCISSFDGSCIETITNSICHVSGGPDYELKLHGIVSHIQFSVSPSIFDHSRVLLPFEYTKTFSILNESNVSIDYKIIIVDPSPDVIFEIISDRSIIGPHSSLGVVFKARGTKSIITKGLIRVRVQTIHDFDIPYSIDFSIPQLRLSIPRDHLDPVFEAFSENEVYDDDKFFEIRRQQFNESFSFLGDMYSKSRKLSKKEYFLICVYRLDFEELVLSDIVKKSFSFNSNYDFVIECNDSILQNTGFSILHTDTKNEDQINHTLDFIFDPSKLSPITEGEVGLSIQFFLNKMFRFDVIISARVSFPKFIISHSSIEFSSVILGQFLSLSFQIQNTNISPYKYHISIIGKHKDSFQVDPIAGVIDKSSYQNFGVMFLPRMERRYENQIQIFFEKCPNPLMINISGSGIRLKVSFDPPSPVLPPIQPFSQNSSLSVKMLNNSNYPIEVFCQQQDLQNFIRNKMKSLSVEPSSPGFLSKDVRPILEERGEFRFCIIVHGPHLSGKTKVAEILSQYLGNACILNLKEIWRDLIGNSESTEFDYLSHLSSIISEPSNYKGVLIDGLDCFEDNDEVIAFLSHSLKQKVIIDEITKNPFYLIAHQKSFAFEQALSYVLSSLDGHYVFFVAVSATDEQIHYRESLSEEKDRMEKDKEKAEKKKHISNMSEEQYLSLSEEQREIIDKRRKASRESVIKKIVDAEEVSLNPKLSSRRSKSKAHSSKGLNTKENDVIIKNSIKVIKGNEKIKEDRKISDDKKLPKKSKGKGPFSDPIQQEVYSFLFTLGSLVQKVKKAESTFNVINPKPLDQKIDSSKAFHDCNSIFLRSNLDLLEVESVLRAFIPSLNILMEKVYSIDIPKPYSGIRSDISLPSLSDSRSELFSIYTEDVYNEQIVVESSRSKGGRSSRKTKTRSDSPVHSTIIEDLDLSLFTPRWNIDANSYKVFDIVFSSNRIGDYSDKFSFGIPSSPQEIFELEVSGKCCYPDIDRNIKSIFSSVVNKLTPSIQYSWVSSINAFHFGYVLLSKDKYSKGMVFPYKANLQLRNTSSFNIEISASINESNYRNTWFIENSIQVIKPGDTGLLTISLLPSNIDTIKSIICITIKDNPDPLSFLFLAECVAPSVEISTSIIDFEKCSIKSSKEIPVVLKNNGKIPVSFVLKNTSHLGSSFSFSSNEGALMKGGSHELIVKFSPNKTFSIKKPFQIDIYDSNKAKLFSSSIINVLAEGYDTSYEFLTPMKNNSLIFGLVKVGSVKNISCTIKNKGKYPIQYEFDLHGRQAVNLLKVSPTNGIISPGDKTLSIVVQFSSTKTMTIDSDKLLSLRLIDPVNGGIIHAYPIPISAEVLMNSYSIEPLIVDFGVIPINAMKTEQFIIHNTGAFPMEYSIISRSENDNIVNISSKGKKVPSTPKNKPKKGNAASMQIGPYLICPSNGLIPPKSNVAIITELQSSISLDANIIATVRMVDPENPEYFEDKDIDIKSRILIPGISIHDYDRIFRNVHLCLRSDLQKHNINSFLEDDHILHFSPVLLSDKSQVTIFISNPNPIPITTDISIKPKTKAGQASFPFDIMPKVSDIPPNSEIPIFITFSPMICESFVGLCEINVRGGIDPETKSFKFALEGNGSLPIISPIIASKGTMVYGFGRVLFGKSREKAVSFKNEGPIPAKFVVSAKPSSEFSINYNFLDTEQVLEPSRTITLMTTYTPTKAIRSTYDINVTVVGNPKSSFAFSFNGEGYMEEIVFEGSNEEDVDVLFRNSVVGFPSEQTFIMKNASQNDIRFSWSPPHDFTFYPRVGHIKSGNQKSIKVVFLSEKPSKHTGIRIPCQWNRIELPPFIEDWDDMNNEHCEPDFKTIANKPKDLLLRLTATSDLIKYQLEATSISFSPTMMYQSRTTDVKMFNLSTIRFDYSWEISNCESLRTNYCQNRPCPFSILPYSGFIEPGQFTVFKVKFSPEEVDDFSALFKCKISNIPPGTEPEISINGISRRPLCHFNVEMSDYISSGRRHPSYQNPLPENISVIEVFSKKIGVKSLKKFEIINPTSAPYEVFWKQVSQEKQIQCIIPQALISSGKRYVFEFSFTPSSAKTTESQWLFLIPEHNIEIHFLFVGKILP